MFGRRVFAGFLKTDEKDKPHKIAKLEPRYFCLAFTQDMEDNTTRFVLFKQPDPYHIWALNLCWDN